MLTKDIILNAIENGEYDVYGIRYDYHDYTIGDVCENSRQWWQDVENVDPNGELTEEELAALYNDENGCYDGGELDGVCAVRVTADTIDEAINRMSQYDWGGCQLILVAGYDATEGNDPEEIIIENATVIAK